MTLRFIDAQTIDDSSADNKTTFATGDGWTKVRDLHTADKIHVGDGTEVTA